jgi:cytochrome c oxidase subunit I+III
VDIGAGIRLPTHATGAVTTGWWATVTLMLVSGTAFACLIGAYLFLWLVNGDAMWPPSGLALPVPAHGLAAIALHAAGFLAVWLATRALGRRSRWLVRLLVGLAVALFAGGGGASFLMLQAAGIDPTVHAYASASWAIIAWQGAHVAIALVMGLYVLVRSLAGKLDGRRRQSLDVTMLFLGYTAGQGIVAAALLLAFPRLLA